MIEAYPTRNDIKSLLLTSDQAVERGVVALYHRQTEGERTHSTTTESNGRGFSAFDAERGSYWARWILGGRKLTGRHLHSARKMCLRYVGQLAQVAHERPLGRLQVDTTYKVVDDGDMYYTVLELGLDPFQYANL